MDPTQAERQGLVNGRHYAEFVESVTKLRREGDDAGAEKLLLTLVEAVEREANAARWPVAPWYYDQLAIIYRARKDAAAEVAILERYARQPGSSNPNLLGRLDKARRP